MTETPERVLRFLERSSSASLEEKISLLKRLKDSLEQNGTIPHKTMEGIMSVIPPILSSSQVIACQSAMECIQPIMCQIKSSGNLQLYKILLHFVFPPLLDRLGDSRMAIRELALSLLADMWQVANNMNKEGDSNASPVATPPSAKKPSSRYSSLTSSIPKFSTPFKSRALLKPKKTMSPLSSQWNPEIAFERDIKARGFLHKTWRVREMTIEWLLYCTEKCASFPSSHFIQNAFSLLDDNHESVRFASKRVLNTIYRTRPELQTDIVTRAQTMATTRPDLLAAITAPEGEPAGVPSSPFLSSRSGSRQGMASGVRISSRIGGSRSNSRANKGAAFSGPETPSAGYYKRASSRGMGGFGGLGGPRPASAAYQNPGTSSAIPRPSSRLFANDMHRLQGAGLGSSNYGVWNNPRSMSQQGYRHNTQNRFSRGNSASPNKMHSSHALSALATTPAPLFQQFRPAGSNHAHIHKRPSMPRINEQFVPKREVPQGVNVYNVASPQMLASEFSQTIGCFSGRESEDNWVLRERAINLYRRIIWGNASIEFCSDLVYQLKDNMFDIFKTVNSLRTSLSSCAMLMCEDISFRLGPHAMPLFDVMIDVLLKQCSQTKKIAAQGAAHALQSVYRSFPLRAKSLSMICLRMSDKSAILRQTIVTTCIVALRCNRNDFDSEERRNIDIFNLVGDVIRAGVVDAQPAVREASRELFWVFESISALDARRLADALPKGTQVSIYKDMTKYSQEPRRQPVDRPMSAASVIEQKLIPEYDGLPKKHELNSGKNTNRSPKAPSYGEPKRLDECEPTAMAVDSAFDELHLGPKRTPGLAPATKVGSRCSNLQSMDIDDKDFGIQNNRSDSVPPHTRVSFGVLDFNNLDVGSSLIETNIPDVVYDEDKQDNELVDVDDSSESIIRPLFTRDSMPNQSLCSRQFTDDTVAQGMVRIESPTPQNSKNDKRQQLGNSSTNDNFPTPESTPLTSPSSPNGGTRHPSSVSLGTHTVNLATPRTQTARYWNGPLAPTLASELHRSTDVTASPLPLDTPRRLVKIESYLHRLSTNNGVDESLFRGLVRLAKEESAPVWLSKEEGGQGLLSRVLYACVSYLQNPDDSRDTVFIKDSCFDVLRVLVRRKPQCFTLDTARRLLLEVLRSRYFESAILSGSAEDVLYDIASHFNIDLCLDMVEDFLRRTPLPVQKELLSLTPTYAAKLEALLPTPTYMDPMNVLKMDNALAGVLELSADIICRLSPVDITSQTLSKVVPYSIACFTHPRSQVRKAALAPIIAIHVAMHIPDSEFEQLLLYSTPESLDSSQNPLAQYIKQLARPELRKLVWSFYLSSRDFWLEKQKDSAINQ